MEECRPIGNLIRRVLTNVLAAEAEARASISLHRVQRHRSIRLRKAHFCDRHHIARAMATPVLPSTVPPDNSQPTPVDFLLLGLSPRTRAFFSPSARVSLVVRFPSATAFVGYRTDVEFTARLNAPQCLPSWN
jgi:hypothetical protein